MKKFTATLILVLIACALLVSATGCSASDKDFFFEEQGLYVVLTDEFSETTVEGQDVVLESRNVVFFALKQSFESLEKLGFDTDTLTLEEYARNSVRSNADKISGGTQIIKLSDDAGNVNYYYDYTAKGSDGNDYFYRVVLTKGISSFWTCQFVCSLSNKDKYNDDFLKWAKRIIAY